MKLGALLFLALICFIHNKAIACSRVDHRSLSLIDGHDSIFVGGVQAKNSDVSLNENLYTFSIDRKLNGARLTKIKPWSEKSSTACGYSLEENKRYLVIAYKNRGKYYSGFVLLLASQKRGCPNGIKHN